MITTMINRNIKRCFLSMLLLSALSLSGYSKDAKKQSGDDKKAKKVERKADRKFVEQDFDGAMKIYESAFKKNMSVDYKSTLHLKAARLYLTLLDYIAAIPHFEAAMADSDELFTSVDVCNYLDALRYSGQKLKAMDIARRYAYKDVYTSDQRYQNILHALTYEDGFLPIGLPEFNISKMESASTPNSEFWIGAMKNDYFFATSGSKFHDPNKKFYHRTRYYSLDENSEYSLKNTNDTQKEGLLHMIPIYLQNGPLAFSRDMTKIIVTEVSYNKGEQIAMTVNGIRTFQTKLYYSQYDEKRRGWSSFKEAFPQLEGVSYAHPFMFDNDRSVLFSSDMPGGFGGYDIYIAHWDTKTKRWGEPINLGAEINTEGDEISPGYFDDMLVFSSNGHVGFGGYDIYGISYENNAVVAGSLTHFDYPVNTVLNDFSMLRIDNNTGYIVSDRHRVNKDDIFYFERNKRQREKDLMYGMSESRAIANGAINLMRTEGTNNSPREVALPKCGYADAEKSLSIYFDFDHSRILPLAASRLESWFTSTDFKNVESISIEGYADEMGTERYNYNLSTKRAENVAQWLTKRGISVNVTVQGRGPIAVSENDTIDTPFFKDARSGSDLIWSNQIWMNRKARRVDIKVIIK